MSEDRWHRIEALFQEAVELEATARSSFLDRACAGERTLRQEVDGLLASHDQDWSLLDDAALEAASVPFAAERPDPLVGQRIGAYQVIRVIGRGGIGTVYLAQREDDQYRQQVAIKLIKRGMDTDFIVGRFLQERQILANLAHPGIAKLLDGGATEDGRPYVVMEHIEGEPIDRYCDHHRLSVDRRLALFRRICAAVHFAHQNLVIHRDLKPSNILVTAGGEPKLLDFGTAKLLDPAAGRGATHTVTGLRLLTPGAASPEQVRGGAITTASDVYSLGVLLYQLLTGHRPYRVASRHLEEIARVVCTQQPERPSVVVGRSAGDGAAAITPEAVSAARGTRPKRLARRLRGDLDNIILMALRKEPSRRYRSVHQLSEDLRRHQQAQPVMAHRDTLGYRAARFVRRHRGGVAAAALILVTLLTATVITAWQARVATAQGRRAQQAADQAREAQARAEAERATAEQVARFMADLFKASSPREAPGETLDALELLAQGEARIATELADQPAVRARLMDTIGAVYRDLGQYQRAEPLLEEALAIRRRVLGDQHPDIASNLDRLARLKYELGQPTAAEPLFREALAMRRAVLGEDHAKVTQSLFNLGVARFEIGDFAGAEDIWQQALDRSKRLHGEDDELRATILHNLGLVLFARDDLARAERLLREALARKRQELGQDHPDLATQLYNLGDLRRAQGAYAEAEDLGRQALAMWRKVLDPRHPLVAYGLFGVAQALQDKGDLDAAEPLHRQALAIRLEAHEPGHLSTAESQLALGRLLLARGDAAAAEPLMRAALEARRAALPAGHWLIGKAASLTGACLATLGDADRARPLLDEGVETLTARLGTAHSETAAARERRQALAR